jgi:hypothetical protein
MSLPIEEYFRYHPPVPGSDRIRKHDLINKTTLELAKIIDTEIKDPTTRQYAIFALQQCRMFANQGITVDDIESQNNYK